MHHLRQESGKGGFHHFIRSHLEKKPEIEEEDKIRKKSSHVKPDLNSLVKRDQYCSWLKPDLLVRESGLRRYGRARQWAVRLVVSVE